MDKIIDLVINGELTEFKARLMDACDKRLASAMEDIKKETGKAISDSK